MRILKQVLIVLYKIFFIGLLLQFFAHTLVTFAWWFDAPRMEYVWLWKEWVIGLLWVITLCTILFKRRWKQHFKRTRLNQLLLLLILSIVIAAGTHFYFVWGELGAFLMAFKYDFLWFAIFLVAAHSSLILDQEQRLHLIDWYGNIIKYTLLLALLWYLIIFIKPGTLKLFWYDNFVYEGLVGTAPPAAYYTQINRWLPRNQFLFERPITRWFYLIAVWPLFFVRYLRKKPMNETWLRRIIYALNIIVTFSRAARWAWIIQLVILWILLSTNRKKSLLKYGIPILIWFIGISVLWFDQIMDRWYSNYGHVTMLKNWRAMFMDAPLRWNGWATAWPWSHRWGIAFNPENQFLQVMIEFWLVWFIWWFGFFVRLCIRWVLIRRRKRLKVWSDRILLWLSVWMIGLAVCWMALHSFSDRMVVYPFMLLYWLWATYRRIENQTKQKAWIVDKE